MRFHRIVGWSVVVVLAGAASAAAAADVVEVQGPKPVKVQMTDLVRVVGKGIAGAQITARIEGAGKLQEEYKVRRMKDGHPLIGTAVHEYLIKPTMAGKISIRVTVKNPTGGETVEKYTVLVE